jgi:hypothetical protein
VISGSFLRGHKRGWKRGVERERESEKQRRARLLHALNEYVRKHQKVQNHRQSVDAPLDGVLADVDVLGPLHLVDHVLGVLAAGQRRHAPAAAGGVAARAGTEPDRQIRDSRSLSDVGKPQEAR